MNSDTRFLPKKTTKAPPMKTPTTNSSYLPPKPITILQSNGDQRKITLQPITKESQRIYK